MKGTVKEMNLSTEHHKQQLPQSICMNNHRKLLRTILEHLFNVSKLINNASVNKHLPFNHSSSTMELKH